MTEENQVTTQQVTTKNPKKVEAGKRLAEYNHRKREELKAQKSEAQKGEVEPMLTDGIGAILAVWVMGGLGYYLYQAKKGEVSAVPHQQPSHPRPQKNKFEMEKSILYYKMDKKSIVNDLYHASLISVFAVGFSMLGKKVLKMAAPSIQKFDLEDTGKLVAIIAASEMTREYLIKQKILPEHINV